MQWCSPIDLIIDSMDELLVVLLPFPEEEFEAFDSRSPDGVVEQAHTTSLPDVSRLVVLHCLVEEDLQQVLVVLGSYRAVDALGDVVLDR